MGTKLRRRGDDYRDPRHTCQIATPLITEHCSETGEPRSLRSVNPVLCNREIAKNPRVANGCQMSRRASFPRAKLESQRVPSDENRHKVEEEAFSREVSAARVAVARIIVRVEHRLRRRRSGKCIIEKTSGPCGRNRATTMPPMLYRVSSHFIPLARRRTSGTVSR